MKSHSINFEIVRYCINGAIATSVHYGILTFNLNVLLFSSTGVANLIASFFGIIISFLGSRYFVFNNRTSSLINQSVKFGSLYIVIAIFHGLILLLWSDLYNFDYRYGFILATIFQIVISYICNKLFVFKF